jgi:hypothetical protein
VRVVRASHNRLCTEDHRFQVGIGRCGAGLGVGFQLGDFGSAGVHALHHCVLDGLRRQRNLKAPEFFAVDVGSPDDLTAQRINLLSPNSEDGVELSRL